MFYWLQSVESPDLAFVVTDPSLWTPEYKANIRREQMDELSLGEIGDAQVLAIVNKRDDKLTLNLQGTVGAQHRQLHRNATGSRRQAMVPRARRSSVLMPRLVAVPA